MTSLSISPWHWWYIVNEHMTMPIYDVALTSELWDWTNQTLISSWHRRVNGRYPAERSLPGSQQGNNIGNKGYIHGNLKDCNSKLQKLHGKSENVKLAYWIFWKKGPRYYRISFYSKYIPTFSELVIKNTHFQRIRPLFVFKEWFYLCHG